MILRSLKDNSMKVYDSKMFSKLSLDQVFSRIFDKDFGLSEVESINEDDEGMCFGKSKIDRKAILSMGRVVAPDLSSGESGLTEGEEL